MAKELKAGSYDTFTQVCNNNSFYTVTDPHRTWTRSKQPSYKQVLTCSFSNIPKSHTAKHLSYVEKSNAIFKQAFKAISEQEPCILYLQLQARKFQLQQTLNAFP